MSAHAIIYSVSYHNGDIASANLMYYQLSSKCFNDNFASFFILDLPFPPPKLKKIFTFAHLYLILGRLMSANHFNFLSFANRKNRIHVGRGPRTLCATH